MDLCISWHNEWGIERIEAFSRQFYWTNTACGVQWNDLRDTIVEDADLIKAVDSVGKEAAKHGLLTEVVSFLFQNTTKQEDRDSSFWALNNNQNNYRLFQ